MPNDYEEIGRYLSSRPTGTSTADVAKYILLNAQGVKPLAGSNTSVNKPLLMSRIFDILSRGNYAAAELTRSTYDPGVNPLTAIFEGLSGKKKTTFQDVLKERAPDMPSGVRAALGLSLDIALDPLTYTPIPVGKGISKLKGLSKTPEPLDKTFAQDLLSKGEPVYPEAFGLPAKEQIIPKALAKKSVPNIEKILDLSPKAGFETSQPPLPGFLEKLKLPDIIETATKSTKAKEPAGQLALRFPGFSLKTARATDVVEQVAKQDPVGTLRILPQPKPKIETRHQEAADEILAGWDNTRSTAQLNKQYPDTLNAKQQVGLYYRAIEAAKKGFKNPNAPANIAKINSNAYKIYLAMEQILESQGLIPRIGTGENVRLSDIIQQLGGSARAKEVLDEFGDVVKEGSPTWQALQGLRAQGAIDESKSVKLIVDKIAETKTGAEVPEYLTSGFDKFLKKIGETTAKSAGLSPAASKATAGLVDMLLSTGKSRALVITEQKAKLLDEVVAKSKVNAEINKATTRALEADLGQLPRWAIDSNKAVEFFMGRVATWWGQSDLRPLSLNAIGAASATAAARGRVLDRMFAPFELPQRHEALRAAQGLTQASTPETVFLANQIRSLMEYMVGQASGKSVLLRAGLHIDSLNKWLDRYGARFNFTQGKIKDLTGVTHDFSKGTDWLNSWKVTNIEEDPKIFLFKMQQALEQATREKALFDEIGERFGALVPGKGFATKISGYSYIEPYYFTSDIAKQLPRVIRDWTSSPWTPKSPLVKHYDRVLSMWKSGVTIYRPGHHLRNLVGDIYLGWMDGVNSLRPYTLAMQVQKSMKGAYEGFAEVDQLVAIGAMPQKYGPVDPKKVLFRNRSGTPFTAEQIAAVAHQKGLLEHTRTIEDIIDLGEQSRFRPFGGKVQAVARGVSELNTHFTRLAHFIDKVQKSSGNDLADIFEQASRRARKWHPTGLDLTEFERHYLRRIIPFYSWIRKSTPLLLEGLVMNPGKAVIPAKGYEALQEATGIDTPSRAEPFPVDQMFPAWLRAHGVGPIAESDSFLGKFSNQLPTGYVMGGVGLNPLQELIAQIETPAKTVRTSLTPGIQIPTELVTGREMFTQEPIAGLDARPGAMSQYIGEQIPFYAPIQSITGITPFGTETRKKAETGNAIDIETLMNWLTASGIRGTGPYRDQARYEALASGKMRKKIGREELLQQLREMAGE